MPMIEWQDIPLSCRNAVMRGLFARDGVEEPPKAWFAGKSCHDILKLPDVGRKAMNCFAEWLDRPDLAMGEERRAGVQKYKRSERTSLYRCFAADGELLYVGISLRQWARFMAHSGREWFPDVRRIELEHFDNQEEARAAELKAIRAENPKYNREGRL